MTASLRCRAPARASPCCRGYSASSRDGGGRGPDPPHTVLCLWESLLQWYSDPSSKYTLHRAANGNHMAERGLSPSAVTLLSSAGNPSAFGEAISQRRAGGPLGEAGSAARAAPLVRGRGGKAPRTPPGCGKGDASEAGRGDRGNFLEGPPQVLPSPYICPQGQAGRGEGTGEAARQKLCDRAASGMNVVFFTPNCSPLGAKSTSLAALTRQQAHVPCRYQTSSKPQGPQSNTNLLRSPKKPPKQDRQLPAMPCGQAELAARAPSASCGLWCHVSGAHRDPPRCGHQRCHQRLLCLPGGTAQARIPWRKGFLSTLAIRCSQQGLEERRM